MSELGDALKAARTSTGLSLARMAELTHYSASYLSLIENGRRRPAPAVVAAYEQVLAVPIGSDAVRLAHEWLVSEPLVMDPGQRGHGVESIADALDARVVELRLLDDTVSSAELLPVVRRELAAADAVARSGTTADRRLLTAVGELAQLAGWIASDAGRHAEAQRHYLHGVSAARAAGRADLAANLFSSLSYQFANVGDPRDALLLARTAVTGADGATPVVRTLLLERVAWAAARAGDRAATDRALDAVDDAFELRSPDAPEPEWVYWLDRAEVDVMAARCRIQLGDPVTAAPLLAAAIAGYPQEHSREVALYLSWLAESHARTGALDAAVHTLDDARAHAARMPSDRVTARLRAVDELIRSSRTSSRG